MEDHRRTLRRTTKRLDRDTLSPLRLKATVRDIFFFQAEDGIRDVAVTGVQTCALPILTLLFRGVALFFRVHPVAVDFVVPPRETEIGRHHVRARMDVADHACARGNRSRQRMLDGMSRLVFGNRRIRGRTETDRKSTRLNSS